MEIVSGGGNVTPAKRLIMMGVRLNHAPTHPSDWEQGTLAGQHGGPVDSTTRLRTKNFIPVKTSATYIFDVSSGYEVLRYEYDTNYTMTVSGGFNWKDKLVFTTHADTRFCKLLIKKSNDAEIVPDDVLTAKPKLVEG